MVSSHPNNSPQARTRRTAIQRVPNLLTALRLLLVAPIGAMILQEQFETVLLLALVAGVSDGIDGWVARNFDATSRLGSIMDPVADKLLLVTTFFCLSIIGLLPWWLTGLVFGRDLLIVGGVTVYHRITGRIDIDPTWLSKTNTFCQIGFTLLLLVQQVWPLLDERWFNAGVITLAALAIASGADYVRIGIRRLKARP